MTMTRYFNSQTWSSHQWPCSVTGNRTYDN